MVGRSRHGDLTRDMPGYPRNAAGEPFRRLRIRECVSDEPLPFAHHKTGHSMTSDMKSAVAKRSVVISGHKTSVSLEDPFWNEVQAIAKSRHMTVSTLLHRIDHDRQNANLSSAIRVYVLQHLREQAIGQQPSQNSAQTGQWPSQDQMRAN